MFAFDPTIKAGDIIQITVFIGVGISAYYGIKSRIQGIASTQESQTKIYDLRLAYIDAALENAKSDLKSTAAQDLHIAQQRVEIDKLWKIVDELRHWKGFVQPDGEFDRTGRRVPFVEQVK